MIALVIEVDDLLQTIVAAFLAGVIVTFTFSLGLLGAIRMTDASRDSRHREAGAFAALALFGLLATAAAIAFGIVVMTAK